MLLASAKPRSPFVVLTPGRCSRTDPGDDEEPRTMPDGTEVAFTRIGGTDQARNWSATWCEDGLMTILIQDASESFAKRAARELRAREVIVRG